MTLLAIMAVIGISIYSYYYVKNQHKFSLSWDRKGLTLNGVPFSDLSHKDKIGVSCVSVLIFYGLAFVLVMVAVVIAAVIGLIGIMGTIIALSALIGIAYYVLRKFLPRGARRKN